MKKKTTIGIVGFGRFGTLLASVLSNDFSVKVYNFRNSNENKRKAKIVGVELVDLKKVSQSDIVITAVPISKTEKIIKTLAPKMKKGSLLMDTCSVKAMPCKWLKENAPKGIHILGTHPMFGPVTTKFDLEKQTWGLKNKQIILCPLGNKTIVNKIKKYLEKLGVKVIVTNPKDHDKQNAKTLSLVHFLGRGLMKADIGEQKIFTPGYTDLLSILPHTNQDDWQLFYDMHNYNPYAKNVRDSFFKACDFLEEKIIKSNSRGRLNYERQLINQYDKKIFQLLEKRFASVKKIGKIKKEKNLKIKDPKREDNLIKKQQKNIKLSENFVKKLYKLLFHESYKKQ